MAKARALNEDQDLQRRMERYHQIVRTQRELDDEKHQLRTWFIDYMRQRRTQELRAGRLLAVRDSRTDRKYRMTPELAKLLHAAEVEVFIRPGPIDEAIKIGTLPSEKVAPFMVSDEVEYFTVRRVKRDESTASASPAVRVGRGSKISAGRGA